MNLILNYLLLSNENREHLDYKNILNAYAIDSKFILPKNIKSIPMKLVQYENGVTILVWTVVEVTRMNKIKFL